MFDCSSLFKAFVTLVVIGKAVCVLSLLINSNQKVYNRKWTVVRKNLAVLCIVFCMDKVKAIACYKLWLSQLLRFVSFKEKRLVSKTKRCIT